MSVLKTKNRVYRTVFSRRLFVIYDRVAKQQSVNLNFELFTICNIKHNVNGFIGYFQFVNLFYNNAG